MRKTTLLLIAALAMLKTVNAQDAEELDFNEQDDLPEIQIADSELKSEEMPQNEADEQTPTAILDDDAVDEEAFEEDAEEEDPEAMFGEEGEEELDQEQLDEIYAAFDRQVDELMMQDMMADMLKPHFEIEQINAALDDINLMELLADMDAETAEDMQEQLFDAVVEKIEQNDEPEGAVDEWAEEGEQEDEEGDFIFGDYEAEDEEVTGQDNEEFLFDDEPTEMLPEMEEQEEEEGQEVPEAAGGADMINEIEEQAAEEAEEESNEEKSVIEDETEEDNVTTPVKEEKKEEGGYGLFWILTIIFAISLGAGIYLNAFEEGQTTAAGKKGRQSEWDPEAISLTTYGNNSNRNSRKAK